MRPMALFFHCLLFQDSPDCLIENAVNIVHAQMADAKRSGLLDAASEIVVGINGGEESRVMASMLFPSKARIVLHGLDCKTENLTIREIEKWLPSNLGWHVLYFHSKGATRPPGDDLSTRWRCCMMRNLVIAWERCINDLDTFYESVGCHWLTKQGQTEDQNLWAGTFWWARSEYLATLPSIMLRDRIRISGLKAAESRYEAEVWIGNGQRLPRVRDYHPRHPMIRTCR